MYGIKCKIECHIAPNAVPSGISNVVANVPSCQTTSRQTLPEVASNVSAIQIYDCGLHTESRTECHSDSVILLVTQHAAYDTSYTVCFHIMCDILRHPFYMIACV